MKRIAKTCDNWLDDPVGAIPEFPPECWNDPVFCRWLAELSLNALGDGPESIPIVPDRLWDDSEFCGRAIAKCPEAFEYVSELRRKLGALVGYEQDDSDDNAPR